jgi:hypothetical protein
LAKEGGMSAPAVSKEAFLKKSLLEFCTIGVVCSCSLQLLQLQLDVWMMLCDMQAV